MNVTLSHPHHDFFALLWFLLSHLVISYMLSFCHSILSVYLPFYSGTVSCIYSEIMSGIHSDIFSGILSELSILRFFLASILAFSYLAFIASNLWLFILAPSLTFFHMGTAHVDLELEIYEN